MPKYFKNYLDYNPLVMNKNCKCGLLDKSKFRKWGLNAAKFFPIGRGISEGLSIIRRYRKGAVSDNIFLYSLLMMLRLKDILIVLLLKEEPACISAMAFRDFLKIWILIF